MSQLTKLRRRRGVLRSSITRLEKRLNELEAISQQPATADHARELALKLETLSSDFRTYHFEVVDLIQEDDDETLEKEQEILDEHDDLVSDLNIRLKRLSSIATPPSNNPSTDAVQLLSRKLSHLERSIFTTGDAIKALSADHDDVSLIEQHECQLSDQRVKLAEIHTALLSVDDEAAVQDQLTLHSQLEAMLFECCHLVRKLLRTHKDFNEVTSRTTSSDSYGSGVRLPKIAVPTFDGNILNWRQFWEQFCVSVHNRPSLSDAEKLVYLQHALKEGSAKPIIEGLSQSGEQYKEAVECVVARFDRPRLIHQTHVKMILDAPQVRDSNGRELRRLHDVVQQHLRALKSLDQEPSPAFITSIIELKLDPTTMFEWQRHTQSQNEVPHYKELLEFLDHRAQASEISMPNKKHFKADLPHAKRSSNKPVGSFAASCDSSGHRCVLCKTEKHSLYSCPKFKALPHDKKLSTIKVNNICMNCLTKGHHINECRSLHRCRKCQNPHHTLLHIDQREQTPQTHPLPMLVPPTATESEVSANIAATKLNPCSLLMTCQVMITAPNGSSLQVRALLDSGSSASFVSERLVQSLHLNRTRQNISVSGIGGTAPNMTVKSITSFKISPTIGEGRSINIMALVVPKVVCDLPTAAIPFDTRWSHLSSLHLADPNFNVPGQVDLLLGVDVFTDVLLHGRRKGPRGTPVAMETLFGWVLCGNIKSSVSCASAIPVFHSSIEVYDDLIRKFWEVEELPKQTYAHLSQKERTAIQHFKNTHTRKPDGRFVVPLPRKSSDMIIGESRSQAVRRFLSLERSLNRKKKFVEFDAVIQEYFDLQHAEPVPLEDLQKPMSEVFYLPMHAVHKQTSTTTKIRAVFDASAKSTSGVSLNDTLLKGPTIHPPLIDVLLRFRQYRVAITADVSKMYRAIELASDDKDLHRFVWRSNPTDPLKDYRMTRVTFGVSASSFVANMSVKQNALDNEQEFPLAASVVENSFYVDDCLTGADDVKGAISLYHQLLNLFHRGGLLLRKWNSSEPSVLEAIDPSLQDSIEVLTISGSEEYAKTLGLEWNTTMDHFRLTITDLPSPDVVTKRVLVSNVARIFDVLGWCSPTVIKMKILLQRLWEAKLDWDDAVPSFIKDVWLHWRAEVHLLSNCYVPRYFFPKQVDIISTQLHGFSDASENAYAAAVYIRGEDIHGNFHVGLVMAKTKVSPIKRLTIPRLELCGAYLLTKLLDHIKNIYHVPINNVYAWTDSTIVLNWLKGSSRRFKTFVGNRVSNIVHSIPPNRWNHVRSSDNPADCASRGLYPSELLNHDLWWKGPEWLTFSRFQWPEQPVLTPNEASDEENELCLVTMCESKEPIIPLDRYSTFTRFQRITAWIFRFISCCRAKETDDKRPSHLSVNELYQAECYWIATCQMDSFQQELSVLQSNQDVNLPRNSPLRLLRPFLDKFGIIRVGGRIGNAELPYSRIHPIVLHGKHPITRLIILSEHHRMLHASPALLSASISLRFHVINLRRTVRAITRECVVCRRYTGKVSSQQQGQLPRERISPGPVFEKVGIDFAGPFNIKYGFVRKPAIVKAYVCLFVSLTIKAVHLEIVSDLTTEAFIAALRRFISRRGLPSLIWSDHGTNFVGAKRELQGLCQFLEDKKNQSTISEFCSTKMIEWRFIPERAPHFGGLWESAVKSMKLHLRRVTANVRLTFEELDTVICQIEACLNSRPLIPLNHTNDDIAEVLTPAHFLIGRSLTALPVQNSH